MSVASTSKMAYAEVNKKSQQGRILALMRRYSKRDWCIAEVAATLREEKSSVSPRMNELCNEKIIKRVGKRESRVTGRLSITYKLSAKVTL